MKLSLVVNLNGFYIDVGACVEIPELFQKHFVPVDVCDEPLMQIINRSISKSKFETVMQLRQDAAKLIADELTKLIVNEMSKKDTRNGDLVARNARPKN